MKADIFSNFNSSPNGLTSAEVEKRSKEYGLNEISEKKNFKFLHIVLRQFLNLLVYILLLAAIVSLLLGHLADALIIFLVIIINAAIGIFQEVRAEKSIDALKKMIVLKAKVIREGQINEIDSKYLVPGDVIIIEEGDSIPADAKLFESTNLMTVEASLTGESVPVEKDENFSEPSAPTGDRKDMIWLGTQCVGGSAKAIVLSTGENTFIGQIASRVENITEGKNHFREITDKLVKQVIVIAIVSALLIFVVGLVLNQLPFDEIFLFSIASLVSAIPEGLPAILTIVLAVGAHRMAKRNAIVRDHQASETLGIVDLIATDKTGTLTQNTMSIEQIYIPSENKIIKVTGKGWNSEGEFLFEDKTINPLEQDLLKRVIEIGEFSNNSKLIRNQDSTKIIGDPTEASFKVLAEKAKLGNSEINKMFDLRFSSKQKFRAAIVEQNKQRYLFVTGAPEVVMALSKNTAPENEKIQEKLIGLSTEAYRVIALAYKKIEDSMDEITYKEVTDLDFLGLAAMRDPIRADVAEAIQKAHNAGIRVIMLTGDHKETALAVARKIGILENDRAYTDSEISKMSEFEFSEAVKNVNVFARLSPETKLEIAKELQRQGHIVAMTGDGVNDAPALKQADVGISMGIVGTDTAREASEIVLADDNFTSIVNAVEEGRLVFTNIRRSSTFLITTNVAEQLTILTTLFLGLPLPLLASQILWLNLVTDGVNDMALATEKSHGTVLSTKPKNKKEGIFTRGTIRHIVFSSVIMLILTLSFFFHFLPEGVEKARTIAFLCMSFTQLFNALNLRSFTKPIYKIGFFSNKFVIYGLVFSTAITFVAIYWEPLRKLLSFEHVEFQTILLIILLSSSVFILGELYKILFLRNHKE